MVKRAGTVTWVTVAAACAACTVAAMQAVRALGGAVPPLALLAVAALSSALAAILAGWWMAAIWRGPTLVSFSRRDAVLCDVAEAAAVRSAAQLRGTMGGAGYVHRLRLVFPAIAWGALSAQSVAVLVAGVERAARWPLLALGPAVLLSILLPARSFWYREVSGGCLIVHPRASCEDLLDVAGVEPAFTAFDQSARREEREVRVASSTQDERGNAPAEDARADG